MAKIWYSVFGEGMGHAMRSLPVIEVLSKKHEVLVTAGDSAYPYLKKRFKDRVYPIKSAHFSIEDNEINIKNTLDNFLKNFSNDSKANITKIFNIIKRFKPNVIISDFEPAAHYFAIFFGIPLISLDNIQVMTKCNIDVEEKYWPLLFASQSLINIMHPPADYYLITTLHDFATKGENVELFRPLLRKEIIEAKTKKGEHILVYQTSSTNQKLVEELKKTNEKYIFYGMGRPRVEKNIIFEGFSAEGFIKDFSSCRGAILNGGFTGISEALYMKKPMLIVPVKNQFEQMFNGMTIEKMKVGEWHEQIDSKVLNSFSSRLDKYEKELKKIEKWDNEKIFVRIEELIENLKNKKRPFFDFFVRAEEFLRKKRIERTLTIIKPDGVEQKFIGEIIAKFEKLQINLVAMKMIKINPGQAKRFYEHLEGKLPRSVFGAIVRYMSSDKVVLMVWQGNGVINKVRKLCGPTNPKLAKKGHIRFLSKDDMEKKSRRGKAVKNIIHSSANKDEAKREINFFFRPWEIMN